MLSKEKKNKFALSAIFLLQSVVMLADDGDEIDPPPAAPIDDYIPLMLFIGVLLVFYVLHKGGIKLKSSE